MRTSRFLRSFLFRVGLIFVVTGTGCFGQVDDLPKPPDNQRELEEAVDAYQEFDLEKIEKVVKAFLESATVTERARYVRDPKRVVAFMKKFYGGEKIKAEGFESLDKSEVSYRGHLLTSQVMTGEFNEEPIAVERIPGKPDAYLVDWESWVGYSEMTVAELKKNRPVTPVMIRAVVTRDSYFNYEFEDDEVWDSYKLVFRYGAESFPGYAKKDTKTGKSLFASVRSGENVPLILKVAYPADARSDKSVEIVEVVTQGWLIGGAAEVKKEK